MLDTVDERPEPDRRRRARAGLALIIGLLAALWSASGYVGAFGRAMNRIYEIEEGRPFWKLRPVMLLLTLIAVVLTALALLMLIVSGPVAESIGNVIGLGDTAVTVWSIVKWPILLLVVVLVVALLYYATPNVKQPKFRWISRRRRRGDHRLGAGLGGVRASTSANFSSYNKTYGSLAGVIVTLLFLWITNLALLFGGRARRRARTRAAAPGRYPRRGGAPAPRAGHPQHQEGREEAGQGRRDRPQDPSRGERSGTTRPGAGLPEERNDDQADPADRRRIGYVLGAKAGRERYDQIIGTFNKVKDDPRVQEKAQQATDLAKEKAPVVKDKVTEVAGCGHLQGEVRDRLRTTRSSSLNPDSTDLPGRTPAPRARCPDRGHGVVRHALV